MSSLSSVPGTGYQPSSLHDIGGVVTALGSEVSHLRIGDRVVGFSLEGFSTYQRPLAVHLCRVEDETSFEVSSKLGQAGSNLTCQAMVSIPVAFATAIYGLQELAHVEEGEVDIPIKLSCALVRLTAIPDRTHIRQYWSSRARSCRSMPHHPCKFHHNHGQRRCSCQLITQFWIHRRRHNIMQGRQHLTSRPKTYSRNRCQRHLRPKHRGWYASGLRSNPCPVCPGHLSR